MRWGVLALALLLASLVVPPSPASADISNTRIGSSATLLGGGHVAMGTVLLACTAGEQIAVSLTLSQIGVSGTGYGGGQCTGGLTTYDIAVPAHGGTFTGGSAAACATAENRAQGSVVDSEAWCQGITLIGR